MRTQIGKELIRLTVTTKRGITYELLIRSALRYEVKVYVPADETIYYMNQAISELGRDAEIPGFRKGRASPEGVRAHYGENRVRERLSADETPITKKFYSDGRQLIQQLDSSNNAEFDYLRGPTGLDRQWNEASEKRYFYIKDPLGTVWAMIESGFTPQQSPIIRLYNYNAWGEHIDASDINFPDYNDDPNLMRYIGCRVEAFGKPDEQRYAIYHLDLRNYIPLGIFIQRDPQTLVRIYVNEMSTYIYSKNNPANNSDPYGLICPIHGCSMGMALGSLMAPGDEMTLCLGWNFKFGSHFISTYKQPQHGNIMTLKAIGTPVSKSEIPKNCWICHCRVLRNGNEVEVICTIPAGSTPPDNCSCNITFLVYCINPCGGIGTGIPGEAEPGGGLKPPISPWPSGDAADSDKGKPIGSTLPFAGPGEEPGWYPDCFEGCSDAYEAVWEKFKKDYKKPPYQWYYCLNLCVISCFEKPNDYGWGYAYMVNCLKGFGFK